MRSAGSKFSAAVLVLSLAGIGFIQSWEGTRQEAYLDSVNVPTICTGSTTKVFIGQRATLQECEERLREDTTYAGRAVQRLVTVKLTQAQYDALVSLVFNIGPGGFARSTLLKKLNAGDCLGAAREWLRWDKAGGKRLRGLTNRRQAEAKEFVTGCSQD